MQERGIEARVSKFRSTSEVKLPGVGSRGSFNATTLTGKLTSNPFPISDFILSNFFTKFVHILPTTHVCDLFTAHLICDPPFLASRT